MYIILAYMQDVQKSSNAYKHMFSMMPEPMEYIMACCEHVLCRATPNFKTMECQTGSTHSFHSPEDTNEIRKRTFKQLRQKLT